MCNKEYKIFAALHDDVSAGNVWITQDSGCKSGKRQIAKITNPTNKNTIYCECLQIDNNFLEKYNEKVKREKLEDEKCIVMNQWYRNELGLETQKSFPLEIKFSKCPLWGAMVAMNHPQIIVRQAFWLGAIGVALGLFGVIFGLISIL